MVGGALPPAACLVASSPEGPPEAIWPKSENLGSDTLVVTSNFRQVIQMESAMKFSVEIDRKSLRVFCVFSIAAATIFWGAGEGVSEAISLYLILKG